MKKPPQIKKKNTQEDMLTFFSRITYKTVIFLVLLSVFFLISFVIYFFVKDSEKKRFAYSRNATRCSRWMIKAMGVKVKHVGTIPKIHTPFLYVSNHIGFLDVLVSNSLFPMFFVTSLEMRETPFLGLLTDFGGCLYVDRKNRSNIHKELEEMIYFLKSGYQVVLYPEATSSNAEQILPFKRTLLSSAAIAEVPIQPVVFNVIKVNGEPFSLKWRDHVCWYGEMPFMTSVLRIFSLKESRFS
nr:lysophospholipid acyltransferase family protein [Pseudobdellovibrionaceae bacterium]